MSPVDPGPAVSAWSNSTINPIQDEAAPQRAHAPDDLIRLFSKDVWRYASSQIVRREDAEDVVMEVFAAAFADFAKLHRVQDQRLWLLGIARKKVADFLRRKYRRAERAFTSDDRAVALGPGENADAWLATRNALEALPEIQREALILKYLNGLSTEEVGAVIRKSLAATNSLLQRGRNTLREALGAPIAGVPGEPI